MNCIITFGNLLGNTFDALLSRLAGSSLWSELGVILGGFVIVPFGIIIRLFNRLRPNDDQKKFDIQNKEIRL